MADRVAEVFEAIEQRDVERLRELIKADASLASARSGDGLSAVLAARYRDATDLLDVLLAAHPQLDVFDAAAVGDGDGVRELIDGDPSLVDAWSNDGFTPLHLAVFFGHADVAAFLLDRGAHADAVSRNPMSVMPLHSAIAGSHRDAVRVLLEHGAPVNATSHGGFTPLIGAAEHGDEEIVRMLLERGADATARTDDGKTAADFAREHGHERVVEMLNAR